MKLSDFFYTVDYKWVKNKKDGEKAKEFDLISPAGRRLYFNSKVGNEIHALREFLKNNTFVAYMVGPKMAGKGTYTKMLMEIIGEEYFESVSVGDIIRSVDEEFRAKGKDSDIYKYCEQHYRGFVHIDTAFDALMGRSTAKLLPTEIVLTFIKRKIDQIGHKAIFIDGFPRKIDQISYSLYLRELVNYRDDPDFFVLLNLPMAVIENRITDRRICPKCQTSRNIRLSLTSEMEYDEATDTYHLLCDNESCERTRMVKKEGDELGIKTIENRIIDDLELMDMARKMYGIPKLELYNALEVDNAAQYVDDYELTYEYVHNHEGKKVVSTKSLFTVEDHGKKYYSLSPAPVVVQFIKQLSDLFGLN